MIEMKVSVLEPGANQDRLFRTTRNLQERVQETRVSVRRPPAVVPAPPGTRAGDIATIGEFVVAVQAAVPVVAAVVRAVRQWLADSAQPARKVRVEIDGDVLELDAATPEQQDKIVDGFLRGVLDRHERGEAD
ncbi:hypothetical protein [Actinoplanes sp. N902-109]|uniref:effector-associated constant component EACC1 n=1 Tax=Actinoplanes sp. (strain N902-109) TaxID=649831 RepID=UPI0003293ADE|nr:hypothetical protein [Actinoplanes sp. N902-109]AGL17098.1 hypothetical protein L083_3588 [Actinoplanes sp. N902-109]